MLSLLVPGVGMGGGAADAAVVSFRTIPLKDAYAPARPVSGAGGRPAMKDTYTPARPAKGG